MFDTRILDALPAKVMKVVETTTREWQRPTRKDSVDELLRTFAQEDVELTLNGIVLGFDFDQFFRDNGYVIRDVERRFHTDTDKQETIICLSKIGQPKE